MDEIGTKAAENAGEMDVYTTTGEPAPEDLGDEAAISYLRRVRKHLRARAVPTLKYLAETEVHTYAFSVAANSILSFVPFFVLMASIIRYVFHSRPMLDVIFQLLQSYLPMWNWEDKMFILRNLQALVKAHHGIEIMSLVMLLISSTGVFEPLEVALNKVWGFTANRSYLKNQAVSLGLALGCGALALMSIAATGGTQLLVKAVFPSNVHFSLLDKMFVATFSVVAWVIMKFFALLSTIAIFFFIYWLLPNGKVKAGDVFPAAVVTGVLLEIAKYVYMACLPLLDFHEAYGPFYISVTLIFWAFICGMLLLGGAYLSASEKEHRA
jgi:membrane protein